MEQPFDIAAARRNLMKATQLRAERIAALYRKASDDAGRIIRLIAEKYRPGRMYQWGSLLNPSSFAEYSDIDIAVEGIESAEDFFALYGDAMKLTDFPLDIVQMEKIEPEFAQIIRTRGRVVYERS